MTNAVNVAALGSTGVSPGFKNRIINGAMVIDQRNAGASVSITTSNPYTLDRWGTYASQSNKFTVQQNAGSVTPPAGFTNYLGVTSSAATSLGASDYYIVKQTIEGYNIADLNWGTANAKTVTLSFWVRSSLTGVFSVCLDNLTDGWYTTTYTINSANTWEYKTITIPGPTSGTWLTTNGTGTEVRFNLGIGSTYTGAANTWTSSIISNATGSTNFVGTSGATFYITGVQLEVGTQATPFEYRQYQQELALCQRYCPVWTFNGSYTSVAGGFSPGTTSVYAILPYPVTPRVFATGITATGTYVGITAGYGVGGVGTLALSPYGNSENIGLQLTGSSGLTTGAGSFIACVATGTLIATGCEL